MYQKGHKTKKIENNEQDATENTYVCGLNNNSKCIAVSRRVRIYLNKKSSGYGILLKSIL